MSDRIIVYKIPRDTVRFVLATDGGEMKMSPVAMSPGLYIRDPLRSSPGRLMYLAPVDHDTTFYSYMVLVKDVSQFARVFVPETPVEDSEIRKTAVALARCQAEQAGGR